MQKTFIKGVVTEQNGVPHLHERPLLKEIEISLP